jgi:hypothetical protein
MQREFGLWAKERNYVIQITKRDKKTLAEEEEDEEEEKEVEVKLCRPVFKVCGSHISTWRRKTGRIQAFPSLCDSYGT